MSSSTDNSPEETEVIGLHNLKCPDGHRQKKQRVGRGIGSGRGKTSTRGMKGQLARRTSMGAAFEGGQLPIHRRVPKRGFINIHRVHVHGINVEDLELLDANTEVTRDVLLARGLIPKKADVIKLLGNGEISKPLTIKLHRASKSAIDKIEKAGGKMELVTAKVDQPSDAASGS
jgi:large subunit ribosomal protein L15